MTASRVAIRSMLRAELGELVNNWPASLVDEAVELCAGYGLTAAESKRYARRLAERCAEVAWRRRMLEAQFGARRATARGLRAGSGADQGRGRSGDNSTGERG